MPRKRRQAKPQPSAENDQNKIIRIPSMGDDGQSAADLPPGVYAGPPAPGKPAEPPSFQSREQDIPKWLIAMQLQSLPSAPEAPPAQGKPGPVNPPALDLPQRRHGPDYRDVVWDGVSHTFTATQAAIMKVLWEAADNGTPDVGQETLLEKAGSEGKRVSDLFKGHSAWDTMIVSGTTRGSLRLAPPQ